MAMMTLLDIAKRNAGDAAVGLIDETSKAFPEISGASAINGVPVQIPGVGAARTIQGLNYKTLVRVGLPTVGFRKANAGTAQTKAQTENRLVETFIMNPRWGADKAVADRSEDGWEAAMADEADAHMTAAFVQLGKQFYYGTDTTYGGHADGFPGLIDSVVSGNVVDAGGTTATTGSSVWLVKFGRKFVQWVWGANGQLDLSDVELRDKSDGTNNYTAYHQELTAYPGVQVGNVNAVVRIKKLTEDSGKGMTDALFAKALEKFPVGMTPDVAFMSRRSLRQLQASRTATNETGREAPFPTSAFNVPIAPTDWIYDIEALTL